MGVVVALKTYDLSYLSREIKVGIGRVQDTEGKFVRARTRLGQLMIEAQKGVEKEHGPGHWLAWCKEQEFGVSERWIQQCMKEAGSPDPEQATEDALKKDREAHERHRGHAHDVMRMDSDADLSDDLAEFKRIWSFMTEDQRGRAMRWINEA
jgi:hypothetical protein